MLGSGELHPSFALLPWKGSLVPIEFVTGWGSRCGLDG